MPHRTHSMPRDLSEEIRRHVALALEREFPVCVDLTAAEFLRANPHCKLTRKELIEDIARTVIAAGGIVELRRNQSLPSQQV